MARSGSGTSVASLLKKRSLGTIGIAAVALFYVAWPLYAGYGIKSSLDERNVETLNARVDFASVRTSLKPSVGPLPLRPVQRPSRPTSQRSCSRQPLPCPSRPSATPWSAPPRR